MRAIPSFLHRQESSRAKPPLMFALDASLRWHDGRWRVRALPDLRSSLNYFDQ